jgi:hypothetical protein
MSAELHGITLHDRNLSADHLEQFHTIIHKHLHRQNHAVPSELPAPLQYSGQQPSSGTFCCSNALRTRLHNASVPLSRNTASLRTSSNIPRCMSGLLAMLRG